MKNSPLSNQQTSAALLTFFSVVCLFSLDAAAQTGANGGPMFQKGFPVPQTHATAEGIIRAEACAPATALRDLEWNNVRALIENAGALWYNRAIDKGAFIVPKEEGVSVVYGGALWLGGISPDQQLKLAAVRYRNTGNDFWPGPLTNAGAAEVGPAVC